MRISFRSGQKGRNIEKSRNTKRQNDSRLCISTADKNYNGGRKKFFVPNEDEIEDIVPFVEKWIFCGK